MLFIIKHLVRYLGICWPWRKLEKLHWLWSRLDNLVWPYSRENYNCIMRQRQRYYWICSSALLHFCISAVLAKLRVEAVEPANRAVQFLWNSSLSFKPGSRKIFFPLSWGHFPSALAGGRRPLPVTTWGQPHLPPPLPVSQLPVYSQTFKPVQKTGQDLGTENKAAGLTNKDQRPLKTQVTGSRIADPGYRIKLQGQKSGSRLRRLQETGARLQGGVWSGVVAFGRINYSYKKGRQDEDICHHDPGAIIPGARWEYIILMLQ